MFATTDCSMEANARINSYDSIFIYDVSPKVYGRNVICFLITDETLVKKKICYKVYFSDSKGILRISKSEEYPNKKYTLNEKGNISLDGSSTIGYTDKGFVAFKFQSDKFYQMISPNFLDMNNKDRIKVLEEISKQ